MCCMQTPLLTKRSRRARAGAQLCLKMVRRGLRARSPEHVPDNCYVSVLGRKIRPCFAMTFAITAFGTTSSQMFKKESGVGLVSGAPMTYPDAQTKIPSGGGDFDCSEIIGERLKAVI